MEFLLVVAWMGLAGACSFIAAQRGRSPFAWCAIAIAFSPLVAYLVLVAIPRIERRDSAAARSAKWLDAERDESPIFREPR